MPHSSQLDVLHIKVFLMAQKVVLKMLTMSDEKTKKNAIEAAADVYGVDSIAAELAEHKLTIVGDMDTIAIARKPKKVGKIDILSIGPAQEDLEVDIGMWV